MPRHDLYTTIHKGVRSLLFEAAALVDRADFAHSAQAAEAASATERLVHLLEEHAGHEDREIMPVLAAVAPELHADLAADHARIDGLQREVLAAAVRVAGSGQAERIALGRRLHERLWRLAAEHLQHMEREEGGALRALWEHRSDEDLGAIHRRILASIPPARMAEWSLILLPAVSLPERTEMLTPMVRGLPGPALEAILAPARAALGQRWSETAAAIGL